MNLTEHFTLAELTASETAARQGIDNTPSDVIIHNLTRTALLLEQVRTLLGAPVIISSGYRCPALNSAIGGAPRSAHMLGLAADFIAPAFGTPLEVCQALSANGLQYDQLIHEFGRWVHIGLREGEPRRQDLTASRLMGGTTYQKGFHPV